MSGSSSRICNAEKWDHLGRQRLQPPAVLDKWVISSSALLMNRKISGLLAKVSFASAPGKMIAGGAVEHPIQETDPSIGCSTNEK